MAHSKSGPALRRVGILAACGVLTLFAGCILDSPPPKVDTDGDGFADGVDRFPLGQDTIDTDGDRISNAYDTNPYNIQTPPTAPKVVPPPPPPTATPPSSEMDSDGDGLPDVRDPYPLGEDAYLDSDGDHIPDRRDPEPNLPSDGDSDGDGFANRDDAQPFTNNDYDLDGEKNTTDPAPFNHQVED